MSETTRCIYAVSHTHTVRKLPTRRLTEKQREIEKEGFLTENSKRVFLGFGREREILGCGCFEECF